MQSKHHGSGDEAKKSAGKPTGKPTGKPAHKPASGKAATTPDDVQIASNDSFPASDPPGWIDSEARAVAPSKKKSDR